MGRLTRGGSRSRLHGMSTLMTSSLYHPGRSHGSIDGMKLSVSLPAEDVEFLDAYATTHGFDSRSAALQGAVRMLRVSELTGAYEDAWREWQEGGEAEAWEATLSDGIEA